jgi:hypothetical protein
MDRSVHGISVAPPLFSIMFVNTYSREPWIRDRTLIRPSSAFALEIRWYWSGSSSAQLF